MNRFEIANKYLIYFAQKRNKQTTYQRTELMINRQAKWNVAGYITQRSNQSPCTTVTGGESDPPIQLALIDANGD